MEGKVNEPDDNLITMKRLHEIREYHFYFNLFQFICVYLN